MKMHSKSNNLFEELKSPFGDAESFESQFRVPNQYFENLPNQINNRITKPVKISFLKNRIFWIPAVSLGSISLILLVYFLPGTPKLDETISEYQQIVSVWDQSYAEEVYLNESCELDALIAQNTNENIGLNEENILENVSSDDIVNYLKEEYNQDETLIEE